MRRGKLVYREIFELMRKPIPRGLVAHHTCENNTCVNPWHIDLMTPGEHKALHLKMKPLFADQTHCKRGHEFNAANTYLNRRGERQCRACRKLYKLKLRYGTKLAAAA